MKESLTETELSEAERRLGYTFCDKSLLRLALVHPTYANRYGGQDNDRLEYLGDSVLQLVVSEMQYFSKEELSAGEMTKQRQRLVSGDALLAAVDGLNIKEFLLYVGSEANIGKKAISSLFETLTAAIYLDGGYEAAKSFVLRHVRDSEAENYIAALQEADKGRLAPVYTEVFKKGADNNPLFRYRVTVADGRYAEGEGGDITSAKQQAAKKLLKTFTETI